MAESIEFIQQRYSMKHSEGRKLNGTYDSSKEENASNVPALHWKSDCIAIEHEYYTLLA